VSVSTDLGEIAFSPDGEEWIEYGPPQERRRVGFHDYAGLYGVPGLYERVFNDELGMCSADVVTELYGEALRQLGRAPEDERVFDFGAGSGVGGELLRAELGVTTIVGLDIEPMAREAAQRDRPDVYDDFLIADLETSPETFERLAGHDFTAVLAFSAIGVGHISQALLADTLHRLLSPGGLFGFAVNATLVPDFFDGLFGLADAERLNERAYTHRRSTDGTPHEAVAVTARLR